MTTVTERRERSVPAVRVTHELPPSVGGPKRMEARVSPPAEPDAPSAAAPGATADDGDPTWEDAEWE
jgi:hypothetical protein